MRIAIAKQNVKITVTRAGEKDGIFEVEPINPKEDEKMLKKYRDHFKAKGQVLPDYALADYQIEKAQAIIKAWNLEDKNGVALECVPAMIKVAFLYSSSIIAEVIAKADKIASGEALIEAEKEKN